MITPPPSTPSMARAILLPTIAALGIVRGMVWAGVLERRPMLSRWNPEVPFCYEAARWTYDLPLSDPDLCGHGFLDRRDEILRNIKQR